MYQAYLDAHDLLLAGTAPKDIPTLAGFSARMDEDTAFHVEALGVDLRGRDAIERFMVESRETTGIREVSEQVIEHGDLVVSFNHATIPGVDGDATFPVVAVFQFRGDRLSGCWGFAS
jgi:SnoaL-like domain